MLVPQATDSSAMPGTSAARKSPWQLPPSGENQLLPLFSTHYVCEMEYSTVFRKSKGTANAVPHGFYGGVRVAMKVKILAKQAGLQQNRSLYVILRNAVTKNPSSTEVRRSFAFAQDDMERNLDSASDTLSCDSDFDGYGLFDSLKGRQMPSLVVFTCPASAAGASPARHPLLC